MVIWVTGLAGAGKTSFAREFSCLLRTTLDCVVHLDGDELRGIFGREADNSYSRENRFKLAQSYAKLANSLSSQGLIVIISTISLFKEIHNWNRKHIKDYIEIFLDPPAGILKKRDQKNLYSNYENGTEKNISGLDIKVNFPQNPDFHFVEVGETELRQVALRVFEHHKGKKNED